MDARVGIVRGSQYSLCLIIQMIAQFVMVDNNCVLGISLSFSRLCLCCTVDGPDKRQNDTKATVKYYEKLTGVGCDGCC